ncbi:hypothetical protein FGO68_gene11578 [Halteria grandinella]|uniref:Uncharacterized protein n=1 Tax=Halteria grandinella TaxID=5974 RepID=A0A8J8P1J9_HALGN|nr:hypothetical protein FGO68_gene11578 [Halteria grandinella]
MVAQEFKFCKHNLDSHSLSQMQDTPAQRLSEFQVQTQVLILHQIIISGFYSHWPVIQLQQPDLQWQSHLHSTPIHLSIVSFLAFPLTRLLQFQHAFKDMLHAQLDLFKHLLFSQSQQSPSKHQSSHLQFMLSHKAGISQSQVSQYLLSFKTHLYGLAMHVLFGNMSHQWVLLQQPLLHCSLHQQSIPLHLPFRNNRQLSGPYI